MSKILESFHSMIKQIHNFEIARIHQESYVQYLQLLSQIILNCPVDQSMTLTSNVDFLVKNINDYLQVCIQEDQRKKLMNSGEEAQKNIVYQFFFVNYLLSVCQVDVVKLSVTTPQEAGKDKGQAVPTRPVSRKIFIILFKLLEALSDDELNSKLDQVILSRVKHFGVERQNTQSEGESTIVTNSATASILRMILQNVERLQETLLELQKEQADKVQGQSLVLLDEDQLELLVKLLTNNEQHGEMVN